MSGRYYEWTKEAIKRLKSAGLKREWFNVSALHDKDAVIGANISLVRMPFDEMYSKSMMKAILENGLDLIVINGEEGTIRIMVTELSKKEVGTLVLLEDGKFKELPAEEL